MITWSSRGRAFTLVEMVVVLALSAIVGVIALQAVAISERVSRSNLEAASNQSSARTLTDDLTQSLSLARPLGTCSQRVANSTFSAACSSYSQGGSVLAYASSSCVVLYGYPTTRLDTQSRLSVPDLVVARTAPRVVGGAELTLVVERYEAGSEARFGSALAPFSTFTGATGPCLPGRLPGADLTALTGSSWSPTVSRVNFVDLPLDASTLTPFSYQSSAGADLLGAQPVVPSAALPAVALVGVRAVYDERQGSDAGAVAVNLSVALPASSYSRTDRAS